MQGVGLVGKLSGRKKSGTDWIYVLRVQFISVIQPYKLKLMLYILITLRETHFNSFLLFCVCVCKFLMIMEKNPKSTFSEKFYDITYYVTLIFMFYLTFKTHMLGNTRRLIHRSAESNYIMES